MAWTHKAGIRFTSARTAMDPVAYEPLDDNKTWRRLERTMKGEKTVASGNILIEWEKATARQRTLAQVLDRILDERPFLTVNQFDGIYKRLRSDEPKNPDQLGLLLIMVTPEPWQRKGKPSRSCSIDWIDGSQNQGQETVQTAIDQMLEDLSFHKEILEVRTMLINTDENWFTELDYVIPVPDEFAPTAA